MLTGVTALVANDALGFIGVDVIGFLPTPVLDATPWAWKVLGGLVVVYVIVSIVRGGRGGSAAGDIPRDPEVPIELELSEPPGAGHRKPPPQLPAPHIAHPHLLAEGFTGRFPEREELTEWLSKKRSSPVRALVSVGGMGKSGLSWVWLHRDVLGEDLSEAGQDPPDVRTACHVPPKSRP
ncbi:MAG: hypothetical protein ACYSU7_11420, partial [Planctomycetota bacterium]